MTPKLHIATVALAAAMAALAGSAHAVTLDKAFAGQPFLNTALPGTNSVARPELAGTVLADVLQPFSFSGIAGTVQSRVVREDATGTLDFYWRVVVTGSSPVSNLRSVLGLRLGQFGYDALQDADWRSDGLGSVAPALVRVFNPASRPDGAINFVFGESGVHLGAESRYFFLHTDAKAYAATAIFDLEANPQHHSGLFSTFAPAVPEPSTYALLATGMLGIGAMVRRRRA